MASFAGNSPGFGRSAALHALAGLVALGVAASAAGAHGGAVAPHLVQSGVVYLLFAMAMAGAVALGGPARDFGAANRLTLARLVATCLLAGYVGRWPQAAAVAGPLTALATAALVLDGVDGWLARRRASASAFGARFDMEVDALMILVLSALVWGLGKAGAWVLLAGLLRYLFVGAGMLMPWLRAELPPRQRRRLICAVQGGVLAGCLAPLFAPPFTTAIAALSVAFTVWSFAADTVWLYRHRPTGDHS